jgi:hypothetical protein
MPRNKKITATKKREFYNKVNELFADLEQMNNQFERLGLLKVQTLGEAVDKILGMWLNIMDFAKGILRPFKNKYHLIKYSLRDKANRFFPKREAKEKGLAHLLIRMSM